MTVDVAATFMALPAKWEGLGTARPYAQVAPADLPAATAALQASGARLINAVGLDERPRGRGFRILFIFSFPGTALVTVGADLDAMSPAYPTVAVDVHAADWYERENTDLLGIAADGHPLSDDLILHYDWPDGLYPLRKDFPVDSGWPERVRPIEPPPRATGPGLFQYTVGPVRSGIAESARFIISTLGEEIADVATRFFWNHRGIEKLCEGISLPTVLLFAERVAANSAVAQSLAFAQAVEEAAGVEVSARARRIRVVLAELERLYNHMHSVAGQAEATGLSVGHAQGAILTEDLRRLNASLVHHRYLFGSIALGGVNLDLDDEERRLIATTLADFERRFRSYIAALMSSTSHLDRLEETGIVTPEVARDHAVVGPVARGSGIDVDARRDHPYAAYADLHFAVPLYNRGDALARNRVWIDEVYQSLSLVAQAIADLPAGALVTPLPALPGGSGGQSLVEGPRGAIAYWLSAADDGTLYRLKMRPASFVNWHVFHLAAAGSNILTDFPIIDASFALTVAGNDR